MKKQLLILAGLTIMFGAQAAEQQQPPAGPTYAQTRNAKLLNCRAEALNKNLKEQELKDAVAACAKPAVH